MTRLGLAALGMVLGLAGTPAVAATDLIINGDFEQTSLTSSHQFGGTQVTGWTNATTTGYTGTGYNFLIFPGTADTTGFTSNLNNRDTLWGPGGGTTATNYSNNGLTATSPTGGNYILSDGDANFRGAISQTVNGLTVGNLYALTFYWAAAQFTSYSGITTESWNVTFGNSSQTTDVVTVASHGFAPWRQQTMYFVASAVSQTLSFLSVGTPNGSPPTALLDGVSLVAVVPEPATWGVLIVGLAGMTAVMGVRRRNRRADTTTA